LPAVFLFNGGDFEAELAALPGPHARTAIARAIDRDLAPCMLPLLGPADAVLLEEPVEDGALAPLRAAGLALARPALAADARGERLVAWGASPSAAARARALGLAFDAPDAAIVRRVNSKLWSHALERELGCAIPGAAALFSEDEVRRAVALAGAGPWVLKAPFGVAGRGRHLGRGAALGPAALGFARRAIAREGGVLFEPWLAVEREWGISVEVDRGGAAAVIGATESIVRAGGQYAGSRIGADPPPARILEAALEVGARLAREGYRGPAGIDALALAGGGLRPIVEVNARFTMGMVALRFAGLVPPGGAGSWILLAKEGASEEALARGPLGPYRREAREGALLAAPNGRAVFLAAKSREALRSAEGALIPAGR
jgi:hypothetical protein